MSINAAEYENLQIKGPISVVPITPGELEKNEGTVRVHILMGPTGAGKSAFIESLSPDSSLAISKDCLDSVTQQVTCYRIMNLSDIASETHVLMDTPGFLDTKLSESRITTMIEEALDDLSRSCKSVIAFLLYFQPITDIRIGGSKRGAVKLLRAFAASFGAVVITVVTTMWNNVSTPKQIEDANRRFSSLSDEIFKGTSTMEIDIGKFEPTMSSALSILNTVAAGWFYSIKQGGSSAPQYQSLMCNILLVRITGVLRQLDILAGDKKAAVIPGKENHVLLELVLHDEEAALANLQSFVDDLVGMGPGGITALQSLLDVRYEEDPNACSSAWAPTVVGSRQDTSAASHSPAIHSVNSPALSLDSSQPPSATLQVPPPSSSRRSLSSQLKAVNSLLKCIFRM